MWYVLVICKIQKLLGQSQRFLNLLSFHDVITYTNY